MPKRKPKIEDREVLDLEAHRQFVRGEILRETEELTSVIQKREEAEREFLSYKESVLREKDLIEEERKSFNSEKEEVKNRRIAMKIEEDSHRSILLEIEITRKESAKELNRVNSWVLKALDELKEVEEKLKVQKDLISAGEKLIEKSSGIKEEISLLETSKEERAKEYAEITLRNEENLKSFRDKALEFSLLAESKAKEANDAENRKKFFDEEYFKKKSDLEIYAERVEKYYNKAFPDLKMLL